MEYRISNGTLTAVISSLGGELQSLQREGREYLWQGNPLFWAKRAPNLFPYVGRLTNGSYLAGEQRQKYFMKIHGFLPESELAVSERSAWGITLTMESSGATLLQYPWLFYLSVRYTLKQEELVIRFCVTNRDRKAMYFGIGGHPGFLVPLEEELSFEDYHLQFPGAEALCRIGFTEQCYRSGVETPFRLDGGRLDLRHNLFDQDAIVLKNTGGEVILRADKGKRMVRVRFPQMPYLGLWHIPYKKAPYLCIEPWSSLPSRQGVVEILEEQPDLICLQPGAVYENEWSILLK